MSVAHMNVTLRLLTKYSIFWSAVWIFWTSALKNSVNKSSKVLVIKFAVKDQSKKLETKTRTPKNQYNQLCISFCPGRKQDKCNTLPQWWCYCGFIIQKRVICDFTPIVYLMRLCEGEAMLVMRSSTWSGNMKESRLSATSQRWACLLHVFVQLCFFDLHLDEIKTRSLEACPR